MRHKLIIIGQMQVILHISKKKPIISVVVLNSVLYVFIKKSVQNQTNAAKYNKSKSNNTIFKIANFLFEKVDL